MLGLLTQCISDFIEQYRITPRQGMRSQFQNVFLYLKG